MFTDWSTSASSYEWYDNTPQPGKFSKIYYDYIVDSAGSHFYIMNDWMVNTTGSATTDYNEFVIEMGSDTYDLKIYGNGSLTLTKNGLPDLTPHDADYGFGASPNLATPHTMWEISLDLPPGTVIDGPFDPASWGTSTTTGNIQDPNLRRVKITLAPGGGTTSDPIPEPSTLLLVLGASATLPLLRRR
jgi:hypothetical protein